MKVVPQMPLIAIIYRVMQIYIILSKIATQAD